MAPTIVALHLSTASRAPLTAAGRVEAVADRGLQGDRHAKAGSRRQVLFIEAETLEGYALAPGDVREQVTTRGIDLRGLPDGARFRCGGALFELGRECAPCSRMDEVRPGLQQAIEGRRGRFARVVEGGSFAVGDTLELL